MDVTPAIEYIIRFSLVAENITLLGFKAVALWLYVRRNMRILAGHEYQDELAKRKCRLTVIVRSGNIFVYLVFAIAILANIGNGVNIWQILFMAAFAVTLVGVYKMMRYEVAAWRFRDSTHKTDV